MRVKTTMGHNVNLLWVDIQDLPRIWLIPLGLIPQEGLFPWLIYDYTWSGLDAVVLCQTHVEAIHFPQTLLRLIHTIINNNPREGPIFMSKIDLADYYMKV